MNAVLAQHRLSQASLPEVVNLQELTQNDLEEWKARYEAKNGRPISSLMQDTIAYHKDGILTNVADFNFLKQQILNRSHNNWRNRNKPIQEDGDAIYQNVGKVRTTMKQFDDIIWKKLGLEDSHEELCKSLETYVTFNRGRVKKGTTSTGQTKKGRTSNTFTPAEEENLENCPSWVDIKDLINDIYHNLVFPLYDMADPSKYRYEIEKYILLKLYVDLPNVRSAWYCLQYEGHNLEDNIIQFDINGKVTCHINRMKRKSQTPITLYLEGDTAEMMRKHYDTFLKGRDSVFFFRNSKGGLWMPHSFTDCVHTTLQGLFPKTNLNARLLRVLQFTAGMIEDLTEEEKKYFAQERGQSYVPQQANLYNRFKETWVRGNAAVDSNVDNTNNTKRKTSNERNDDPATDDDTANKKRKANSLQLIQNYDSDPDSDSE